MWRAIWNQPHVPAAILELCRLNLARLHRADAELGLRMPLAGKVSEDKIAGLLREEWTKDPRFSETERAVLNFTEWYHIDPQSVPDDVATAIGAISSAVFSKLMRGTNRGAAAATCRQAHLQCGSGCNNGRCEREKFSSCHNVKMRNQSQGHRNPPAKLRTG